MTRLFIGVSIVTATLASGLEAMAGETPASTPLAPCVQCHERQPNGGLARISQIRKTPEGWQATLTRMSHLHGVTLTAEQSAAAVKYLADTQSLAPQETAAYRHALERVPNVVEVEKSAELNTYCGRCHSFARVALERRDAAEWTKLAHFHGGLFPTAEYHFLSRDKEWWKTISTDLPKVLGKRYPFATPAWTAWKSTPKASAAGNWTVYGYQPGKGAYGGTLTIAADGTDTYTTRYDLTWADGTSQSGQGKSIVYTGFEWRGTTTLGSQATREVLALSDSGQDLTGRWFNSENDEIGASLHAVRNDASPHILGLSRNALRIGETAAITLWGNNLDGEISFGRGITVKPLQKGKGFVTVELSVAPDAKPGRRTPSIGQIKLAESFAVYRRIDSVKVEPELGVARIGGNGGKAPQIQAQYEAIGYTNGPDGKAGTKDDIRLGAIPASWSTAPFNAEAEKLEDVKFAGQLDQSGLFRPAGAGPNPQRQWGTNNVGDLKVIATVQDQGRQLSAEGRVISTVQRFIDPSIR